MSKPKTIGSFVASERTRLRLTTSDLARLAGYRRVAKGAKRIARFEVTNREIRPFVERLLTALNASVDAREQCLKEEAIRRNERIIARWLGRRGDDPAPPEIVIRCFAGFYAGHILPDDIESMSKALRYARGLAHRTGLQVILPMTSRLHVLFDQFGRAAHLGRS